MTTKRSSLGRNLSVLLGQNSSGPVNKPNHHAQTQVLKLAIHCLRPGKFQPRSDIEEAPLNDLAASIKKQGVLQPLLVRELTEGQYEIIAGERRWRASQLAGLTEVPVLLKAVDDETAMAIALIENLQREDLNAMDQARAMHRLTSEFALTHQQVAELVSKSRASVTNYLRLLSLANPVKKMLEHGDLDMGHARALLQLHEEQQYQTAQLIVAKNLSVRETEQLIERIKSGKQPDKINPKTHSLYHDQISLLTEQLKTKIQIKPKASGKGALVIHYNNEQALHQLIQHILD